MSENFLLSSLKNTKALPSQKTEEQQKEVEKDVTSIFGTFDKSFLKGITILHSDENIYTPFSRQNFNLDPFSSNVQADLSDDYDVFDDDAPRPTLKFEC